MNRTIIPKPHWLRKKIAHGAAFSRVPSVIVAEGLHTVCEEAKCPNRGECYSAGTATFLILGDRCTRNCRFCAVSHGIPSPPDPDEPALVAKAVKTFGLGYVVVTSVTRDDLHDGGASHFAATIDAIRSRVPVADIEVLVPDFGGSEDALAHVLHACPAVLAHNIETVPRLYGTIRHGASYERSLRLLEYGGIPEPGIHLKSGLMLGLGETVDEVIAVFADLRDCGCEILTIGQYLQPDRTCVPIDRYINPEEFTEFRNIALDMGFLFVSAGPFVRSSYQAEQALTAVERTNTI